MKIVKRVEEHADAVVLIQSLAFCEMRTDLTRFVAADESHIEILIVVGEVRGRGFRRWNAVAGGVLTEIAHC